ncbi:MAG: hypothetical protein R3251_00790 [Candidatus Spechtbacterales bacterium]|nr:hypothetical protein [Candidatus Spechtbacterales bacterium]
MSLIIQNARVTLRDVLEDQGYKRRPTIDAEIVYRERWLWPFKKIVALLFEGSAETGYRTVIWVQNEKYLDDMYRLAAKVKGRDIKIEFRPLV